LFPRKPGYFTELIVAHDLTIPRTKVDIAATKGTGGGKRTCLTGPAMIRTFAAGRRSDSGAGDLHEGK